jgi:hypothetical protein
MSALCQKQTSCELLDHVVGAGAANLPIVCAIYLMYWHARLDRALDHVFRSATARKRHDQIGLAFVEHPLITLVSRS